MSHVLVTGAATGIGLASALRLLQDGHQVTATYHGTPLPPELVGCASVCVDITDPASIHSAIKEAESVSGPVEVLVANAGLTRDTLLARMDDERFEEMLTTNLTSAFRLTKAVLPSMMRARRGRLIYISSIVGFTGSPGQTNYAASKAGLVGFARSVARELGSRNITANVILPGAIATKLLTDAGESRLEQIESQVPLGRVGRPDEVGAVVQFLASEGASYINGALIAVDGGLGMGL
ncbi:3-oxoacyl-ACP reductase FabG [Ferrimicrobium acidiphilum]|uniref:3-oxoacyl-ACP reductase FabG n=1 Tax=Ferrimicrobium acidiphilum TaxID=121039 RepID=UPI0023F41242|nr:3-oxoacyl-ACP reductase FabG [Ferrimicrobium acidiphilum]